MICGELSRFLAPSDLGALADPRRPCFGAGGYRPGDASVPLTMTADGFHRVGPCEDPFQIAAHIRGWTDGCAEFPILTVTRRNLTAALPGLERFLDIAEGSLTRGLGAKGSESSSRRGGGKGRKKKGRSRLTALEGLAAVSHAEDRRHSPWMDPADGLDRLERGLYAYNMKRLFKEGLVLQRSLAAAEVPRMSPNTVSRVSPILGVGRGGGNGEWATMVGRRIDTKRCRVVGTGPMAARALGPNGGPHNSGGLSVPSIDSLVHAVFVSQAGDEDEEDTGRNGRRSLNHVAAPNEMCRGAAADNTVVYRLSRRHVELAVSRATGMGHNACFHEAVAGEAGSSLEGDYDSTAQPPPPPEGIYAFVNATVRASDAQFGQIVDEGNVKGKDGTNRAKTISADAKANDWKTGEGTTATSTAAQDARWRQHLAVYSAFHRSALARRSAEEARYLVLKLPPVFDARQEATAAAVSTLNTGEGTSVIGLLEGRGGLGHTKLRPPSGAPFNLILSAGLLALLSNRVLLVDFSRAPRLRNLLAAPDGIDWDVDNAIAKGHDETLLRPTRGDHSNHAGVMDDASGDASEVKSVRWLCHEREETWGAELRAGSSRRLCSAAEKEAMRTRDVRKMLGGIGGLHARDGIDGAGEGGGGGWIRSVVLDTEELEGSLWRHVCGGGPPVLAKTQAHEMIYAKKSKAKTKMSKGERAEMKAAIRGKRQYGGWADDDTRVVPAAAAAEAEAAEANVPLAPNPNHARWCRELFGNSSVAVGGRLFSWLVRPAGPLKIAVESYFKRILKAGFTVWLPYSCGHHVLIFLIFFEVMCKMSSSL